MCNIVSVEKQKGPTYSARTACGLEDSLAQSTVGQRDGREWQRHGHALLAVDSRTDWARQDGHGLLLTVAYLGPWVHWRAGLLLSFSASMKFCLAHLASEYAQVTVLAALKHCHLQKHPTLAAGSL